MHHDQCGALMQGRHYDSLNGQANFQVFVKLLDISL